MTSTIGSKTAAISLVLFGSLSSFVPIYSMTNQLRTYQTESEFHAGWTGVVRQTEQFSCGPALIATLNNHLHRSTSEGMVLSVADLQLTGITLAEFQRLSHFFDIPGSWYSGDWETFRAHDPVLAAHWNNPVGHFVSVLAIQDDSVVVLDPARGIIVVHPEKFREHWSGYFYGG